MNKGKSSLVATLSEDDDIDILPTPGTTQFSTEYELVFNREVLCQFVDTPGFEQSSALLKILNESEPGPAERKKRIEWFLESESLKKEFPEEAQLLDAIMSGGIVVYLVDGSHPLRDSYYDEMEIIRWCSMPSMAVINSIGTENYQKDWREILNQYFRQVVVLNAVRSTYEERLFFFQAAASMVQDQADDLKNIANNIVKRRRAKVEQVVHLVMQFINEVVRLKEQRSISNLEQQQRSEESLRNQLKGSIVTLENSYRLKIAIELGFKRLSTESDELAELLAPETLFADQTWEVLGLDSKKLATRAGIIGAAAGAVVDLKLLGLTHFAGSVIGGATGVATSLLASRMKPEAKFAGIRIAGQSAFASIDAKSNMIWILIDRILAYSRYLILRSHANQSDLEVADFAATKKLSDKELNKISSFIKRCTKDEFSVDKDEQCFHVLNKILSNG